MSENPKRGPKKFTVTSVSTDGGRTWVPRGWQPIATAPAGDLLLYFPARPFGRDSMHAPMLRIGCPGEYPHRMPTHWMPLPEPPREVP